MAQDKCKRCGKCCIVKLNIMGLIVQTHQVCPYLEKLKDGKYNCKIYKDRFEIAGWCHPIEDAIKEGSVPNDCGYVEGTDYKSKLTDKINIIPEKNA